MVRTTTAASSRVSPAIGGDQLVTQSHRQCPPPLVHPRGPNWTRPVSAKAASTISKATTSGQHAQMAWHEPTRGDDDDDERLQRCQPRRDEVSNSQDLWIGVSGSQRVAS
jgi:hypothetical protein